jgi:hypothetical protein
LNAELLGRELLTRPIRVVAQLLNEQHRGCCWEIHLSERRPFRFHGRRDN